jgi:hypothetical protein
MIKPIDWIGPIPVSVRLDYRGRVYWCTHWKGNMFWTVEPDDDIPRLVRCSGNSRDAVDEYERDEDF